MGAVRLQPEAKAMQTENEAGTAPHDELELASAPADAGNAHADTCGAPICFERPGVSDAYFWYPGEPICGFRTQDPASRHVRRVQRRIERVWRALPPDRGWGDADIGYFEYDDLLQRKAVRRGIRGRNREAPYDAPDTAPATDSLAVGGGAVARESIPEAPTGGHRA